MTVLPVKSESEMNPPLANDGPSQKSKRVVSPLTCTRRTGAACEAAQNSAAPSQPLPATLIDRFDTDRQKFVRAVQKFVPRRAELVRLLLRVDRVHSRLYVA